MESERMPEKIEEEYYIDFIFRHSVRMTSLSVYWSIADGACLPASWKVMYHDGDKWNDMELYLTDSYRMQKDQFNVVHPASPFESDRIRICVTPQKGRLAAISEVYIE